jgi:hypothetical protein
MLIVSMCGLPSFASGNRQRAAQPAVSTDRAV